MTLPITINDLLVKSDNEDVDLNFFNKRYSALMSALSSLDARMTVYDAQVADLVNLGLQRMNDAMGPMLATLSEAAGLGFLVCQSIGDSHSLTVGNPVGWNITEGADIFTPTAYLLAQDINDSTNWGILSIDTGGWVQASATLATHVVYASKTQTSTSWTISCNAAFLPAMQTMLNSCLAAQTQCNSDLATVAADMATVNSLLASVQSGPVVSVAGKTGAVSLVEGDIANLNSDLANRATVAALNSAVAGLQPASANLSALATLSLSANKVLMASGAGGLTQINTGNTGQSLLAAADAPTARSVLGLGSAATQNVGTNANNVVQLDGSGIHPAVPSYSGGTNTQTGNYTLQATDSGKIIRMNSSSAITLTVPAGLPTNFACMIEQAGTGQMTIAASGTTLNSRGGRLKGVGQYSVAAMWWTASNTFTVSGDLST